MADMQTEIFIQKWFTYEFSSNVEPAVLERHNRASHIMFAPAKLHTESPFTWKSSDKNLMFCDEEAQLPLHVLSEPWTDDKVKLLQRLVRWST